MVKKRKKGQGVPRRRNILILQPLEALANKSKACFREPLKAESIKNGLQRK